MCMFYNFKGDFNDIFGRELIKGFLLLDKNIFGKQLICFFWFFLKDKWMILRWGVIYRY